MAVTQDSREQLSLGTLFPTLFDSPSSKEKIIEVAPAPQPKAAETKELAPMLQHYQDTKKRFPEHLLLFQVGDFYEIFFEDALRASEILNIRLTSRNKDDPDAIPMSGVPIHALDNYLPKLLRAGTSCVIVSQVEDGKAKKGPVQREISRIVTPGVRFEGDGLDESSYNFLAALSASPRGAGALSFADVSTGVLRAIEAENIDELVDMLQRVAPAELILPSVLDGIPVHRDEPWLKRVRAYTEKAGIRTLVRPFETTPKDRLSERLHKLFSGRFSQSLEKLGSESVSSMSALLDYVDDVSFGNTPAFAEFSFLESGNGLVLDAATRRNLELTETRIDGDRRNSLIARIDFTRTAMGARQLGEWILSPSTSLLEVTGRHEAVKALIENVERLESFREVLVGVRDIDRLVSRVTTNRAMPADLGLLRDSLRNLPVVSDNLSTFEAPFLVELAAAFDPLSDIAEKLSATLVDQPPVKLLDGGVFKEGVNPELDRLVKLANDGSAWLSELEQRERQASGISGLKVKYNNVFGYFIEITKAHLEKVPAHYERRQTLTNAERFVTRELKEFEQEVLSARARQIDLERELFVELRKWIGEHVSRIQHSARVLSTIDVLCSFAFLARKHAYVQPVFTDSGTMKITGGRHSVVEQVLGHQNFVPNDILLDCSSRRFAILTGPNMGGKSTYLRQAGLIQLLAQAGSFVPAVAAELSIVDRIFTRIGAADDLARGDSTFMMEMREAAVIAKKATERSLVLVDELGRGTATVDGLALAWAVAEWLHDIIRCKSLFATHFHELNALADEREGAFCLSVGVVESQGEIEFTHRIEEHPADRSYGLEVAALAGLPSALLSRAKEVFREISQNEFHHPTQSSPHQPSAPMVNDESQREILQRMCRMEEFLSSLKAIDINRLTPMQALSELEKIQQMLVMD